MRGGGGIDGARTRIHFAHPSIARGVTDGGGWTNRAQSEERGVTE